MRSLHTLPSLLVYSYVICSVSIAVDALRSSSNPHAFMGVTEQGLAAIVKTRGNQDVHVILRGGANGPNYAEEHVKDAASAIENARPQHHASIMIDCSREYSSISHSFPLPLSWLLTCPTFRRKFTKES